MKNRSLFLILLLAVFMPWAANAQTTGCEAIGESSTSYGAGGYSGAGYVPVDTYYKYSYEQMVYDGSEMPTTITSISFKYKSSYAMTEKDDVDIYLGETTTATLSDWMPASDLTLVYSGALEFPASTNGEWVEFEFNQNEGSFSHDQSKYIVVVINDKSYGYPSNYSYMYFCYESCASGAHKYLRNDSSGAYTVPPTTTASDASQYPIVRFCGSFPVICCPKPKNLACTATTGTPATATFTWTNGGEETQWLLEYSENADFSGASSKSISQTDLVEGAYTLNGLTAETKYYGRIKAYCPSCNDGNGAYSDPSNTVSFEPTNAIPYSVYDDPTTLTTNSYVPIISNWQDRVQQSEYIIPAEELANLADGKIKAIKLYPNYDFTSTQTSWQVYVREVENATFSNTTFYGIEGSTVVYSGGMSYTSAEGLNVTFNDGGYTYNGGNLLIGFYQGTAGNCVSGTFNGQNVNNSSLSRYGTNTPTQRNFIPKTTFTYLPSATPKPTNLHVVNGSLSSSGATLAWDAPTTATPTGYQYQYKEGEGEWTALQSTTNLSVALSLNASKTYTFQVRATYDGVGESAFVETTFTTLDDCAFPTNLLAYTVPGQGTKATLTWVKGYDEEAWVLQYATNNTFTEGLVEVTDGFTVEGNNVTANLTGLTAEQTYYARVKADCDGSTSSWSNVAEFTPTNYVDFPYNANATSAASYTPFYGGYAAYGTHSRFIIPSSSLADLAGGTVRKLTFYSSATTADWGAATFKVYVAEVEASSFTSNPSTSTPFDWSDMTQVFSGTLSLANGEMVILLDEPFVYSGTKNLMIGFEETNKGTNATAAWYYKSGVSYSCAYAYKTYASATSFTTSRGGYSPKMTFNYRPTATPRPIITVPVTTTDVTATIAWTKPSDNVTGYKYQYKLASATEWPTSWTELNDANAVSVTVPNLTPNTSYDFQIKAVYAEGESIASSTSFATTCPAATAVPYSYGFETAPEFNCWEVTSSVSNGVRRTNSYAHVGNYSLVFYGTQLNEIEMPLFNQPTNTLRLEYWVRPEGYQDSRSGSFAIGYYNANDEFVALKTYEFNTTTGQYDDWESTVYIKQSIDFDVDADNDGTPDVPADAHIVFRQFNTTSNYYWMVDDVKVKVIPTCADVNDVHYVSFTNHSATIAWTAVAAQTAWQIAYKAGANFNPNNAEELATATVVDVTSNPYLFDKNLEAATTYYMYVRGNCGDVDGLGDWSDSYATFTTKAAAPAPSNFTASNFGKRTVDLVWTAGGGDYETSWELYYVASATAPTAPDNETEATKTVNTLPTTEEPYTLGGLTPETIYYIWVRANHGNDGKSVWTALTGSYFTTIVACPAPTNVAASNITNNSAEISWEGDANGYNVQYREYAAPTETLYDFENGMGDWTTIDADNDGFNWVLGSQAEVYLYEGNLSGNGYNGSSDLIASGSYRNTSTEGGEALNPDNYLVSPMITLGGTISFYACGTDGSYYSEHFGVFVSTNSNDNPDDFVMVNEWTATSTSYTQYSADLSAYSGKGYVAIRHFDCSDQFVLRVDNITITDPVTEQPWTLIEDVTSPQPIPGLTAETTYEVQVQAVCGGEDGESVWTSLAEPFTTLSNCSAPGELNVTDLTANSATLNWIGAQDTYNVRYSKLVAGPEVTTTEDFSGDYTLASYNADGVLPDGWVGIKTGSYKPHITNNTTLGTSYDVVGIGGGVSGTDQFMYMGNASIAILPQYSNITAISFQYAYEGASNGTLTVGYCTENTNGSSFTALTNSGSSFTPGATTLQTVNLTAAAIALINENNGYLAFRWAGTSSYGVGIDNIAITTQSYVPEAWNEDNVNVNSPLPINNLEMGTTYVWEVQGVNASCGSEGLTEWSETATFNTPYPTFTKEIAANTWYFIASPVGIAPTNMNALSDLYFYDEQDHFWRNKKVGANSDGFDFDIGKGYLGGNETTAVTLTFTGAPITGDIYNVPVTYNAKTSDNEDNPLAGWNLVGNPFASNATIDRPFFTVSGMTLVASSMGTNIAPCEGVMVQAATIDIDQNTINYEDVDEEVTFTKVSSSNPVQPNQLQMTLAQQVVNRDGVSTETIDNAIISFDKGNLLEKFVFNADAAKLYIPQGNKDFAIVSSEGQGEMPVNFRANENGSYTITVNAEGVDMAYLHLIDNKTGNDIDLLETPSYTFNATTTDYESRFRLVFVVGSTDDTETFAFCSNGNWIISNEGNATLQVIDITGRILSSESVNGSVSKAIHAAPGVYMLRLINGNDVKVQKIVVR